MHPVSPKGFTARVGYWSARHKKSVLLGWLLFVVLSVVGGSMIKSNTLTDADQFAGESGRAEKTLEKSFPQATAASEQILFHSSTATADQPAYRAAVEDLRDDLSALPVVTKVHAATDKNGEGLTSKDGHSALISFQIRGDKTEAMNKVGPVKALVKDAQKAHPGLRIEEFGDASVGAEMDKWVQNDLKKAEVISVPLTLIILLGAFG